MINARSASLRNGRFRILGARLGISWIHKADESSDDHCGAVIEHTFSLLLLFLSTLLQVMLFSQITWLLKKFPFVKCEALLLSIFRCYNTNFANGDTLL
jgi:hypothetical protein